MQLPAVSSAFTQADDDAVGATGVVAIQRAVHGRAAGIVGVEAVDDLHAAHRLVGAVLLAGAAGRRGPGRVTGQLDRVGAVLGRPRRPGRTRGPTRRGHAARPRHAARGHDAARPRHATRGHDATRPRHAARGHDATRPCCSPPPVAAGSRQAASPTAAFAAAPRRSAGRGLAARSRSARASDDSAAGPWRAAGRLALTAGRHHATGPRLIALSRKNSCGPWQEAAQNIANVPNMPQRTNRPVLIRASPHKDSFEIVPPPLDKSAWRARKRLQTGGGRNKCPILIDLDRSD